MSSPTESDVRMAYRLILGREPESPEAVQSHMGYSSFSELRSAFLNSHEFKQSIASLSAADVILKHIELSPGIHIKLALPAISDDPIAAAYLAGEQPNAYMFEVVQRLTNPGDRLIDLGAHLGTLSIPAAKLGRRVLSIDAATAHAELLQISKSVNGLQNLTIHWGAVAREVGEVSFVANGLFGHIDFVATETQSIRVPAKPLRAIVDEHHFEEVAFIKADIEGAELLALESISDLLKGPQGPAILYESNGPTFKQAGYSIEHMRKWLEERGYKSFRMEPNGWVYAPPHQPQPEMWVDLVALKPRHQRSVIVSEKWTPEAMVERFLRWGGFPDANVRSHVRGVLLEHSSLLENEDLSKLLKRLEKTEAA